jgi:catechol 2,3-dioxygenase-like lactoylglutathione lyase family enzyme
MANRGCPVTTVWYQVRDLAAARGFYTQKLGFTETAANDDEGWATLQRDTTVIGLAEGDPQEDGAVAHVDVADVKSVAEHLRNDGVDVGVVLELHGAMRLVDVFDPDGNCLQFAEDVS